MNKKWFVSRLFICFLTVFAMCLQAACGSGAGTGTKENSTKETGSEVSGTTEAGSERSESNGTENTAAESTDTESTASESTDTKTSDTETSGTEGSDAENSVSESPDAESAASESPDAGNIISLEVHPEIRGYDWGPAVDRVILKLAEEVQCTRDGEPVSLQEMFTVREEKQGMFGLSKAERTIVKAWFSDEAGQMREDILPGDTAGFITLELAVGPEEGSPFVYNMMTWRNAWCDPYKLVISMNEGEALILAGSGEDAGLETAEYRLDLSDPGLFPELENAAVSETFTGPEGHELSYAFYEPGTASQENRRPLVIWLHGAGEGGKDPRIALLGNRVSALFSDEFQNTMEGAYVLVPQTETFWMQYEENGSWSDNPGRDSVFLHDLKALIDDFVSSHNVDADRILIGGCSNGGFMTMDMVFNYPDMFAAAFPICEAFKPEAATDEMLERIRNLPIWFVYAENDTTVYPAAYEKPLIERLRKVSTEVRVSAFEDVRDTSGKYFKDGEPYEYMGHWSWIYFFNDECRDGDLSLWQWLAGQKRP